MPSPTQPITSEPPPLVIRFGVMVYFGVIIEITMDLFRCFAHGFRTGDITVRWEDLPFFVVYMCFVIGFLAVGLFVQEKLKIDFNKNRVAFVTTFILTAALCGWFNLTVCDKESKQKAPPSSDTRLQH